MNFEAALVEDEVSTYDMGTFTPNPLNLPAAKVDIERYRAEIDEVRDRSDALMVRDQGTKSEAVQLGTSAKKLAKKIEEARKQIIGPASEYVGAVNNFAKSFTAPLSEIETQLKKKINDHDRSMEIQRQQREQAARQAAAELQARLDKEAAEANKKAQAEAKKAGLKPESVEVIVAPQVPEPIMPAEKAVTRTDSGASYQRKTWTFEVFDESLVPAEYLIVDPIKIRQAVRMGIREIPGVKIYEKTETSFRTT
jgi:hypothetical protein